MAEGQACPVILAWNKYTSVSTEGQLKNLRWKPMGRNDQLHTYKMGKVGECNYNTRKIRISVRYCWSLMEMKAFNTVSHNKLRKYQVDKWIMMSTEKWTNCGALRVLISGPKYSWRLLIRTLIPCAVSHTILDRVLFLFINELDAVVEYTLRKSADDTQLEVADIKIVVLPSRGMWIGWKNGLTGTLWNSIRGNVKSWPCIKINPSPNTRLGLLKW